MRTARTGPWVRVPSWQIAIGWDLGRTRVARDARLGSLDQSGCLITS
jgi:hypothetical protein